MAKLTKVQRDAVVASSFFHVRAWLQDCLDNGKAIVYSYDASKAGTTHYIRLAKVSMGGRGMQRLWPDFDNSVADQSLGSTEYSEAMEAIAKEWRFSFKKRMFVTHGGGMDMVFGLVDRLCCQCGLPAGTVNKIAREAF